MDSVQRTAYGGEGKPEGEFAAALRAATLVVAYAPLPDEQEFSSAFSMLGLRNPTSGLSVLAARDTDPFAFAESLVNRYAGKNVVILVPGREFDASGTRHGRGGGWYDRFLSKVPREWLRVGVLNEKQFSPTALMREVWDEPVEYLLIREPSSWRMLQIITPGVNSEF